MSSASVVLTCSVCSNQNVVERLHANMLSKEGASTYCQHCNTVTEQRITGSNTPTTSVWPSSSTSGTSTSAAQHQQYAPPQTSSSYPSAAGQTNDSLMRDLNRRLSESKITLEDILRCDPPTQTRLLESLKYNPGEVQQLMKIIHERSARENSAGGAAASSPPHNGGGGGMYSASSSASPSYPRAGSTTMQQQQQQSNNPRLPTTTSPVPGLSMQGDHMIARCSVYPELAAEFWCCSCNVLVSSRCHVQGAHKDHPFITLRVAAEAHVRDLSAWTERCRSQLNVTGSIVNNLRHAENTVQQAQESQYRELDALANQMVDDLMRWKEQVRQDLDAQFSSQVSSIRASIHQTEQLQLTYTAQLNAAEPLVASMPPVEQRDKFADDWSLRILDIVSKLKLVNTEPVPMPRMFIPQVSSAASPATFMELLKIVKSPLGVRLPDVLDPGYFNFPHPATSAKIPFTLAMPDDALAKGVLVFNGRTLTRSQDITPNHTLVLASQVFYSGVTSWEVHIDRMGPGPGRILCGVIINGTEGEGVVWDGQRIVGPNEGECRNIDEAYVWRPGTVLRFQLELEGPVCYLNCFYDRDGVARVPLPATGHGWVPAFSVFGPTDQVTVVPTSSTQQGGQQQQQQDAFLDTRGITTYHAERASSAAATGGAAAAAASPPSDASTVRRQEQLIQALQQQIHAVSTRLDHEQHKGTVREAASRGDVVSDSYAPPRRAAPSSSMPQQQQQQPTSQQIISRTSAPVATGARGTSSSLPRTAQEAYSPELKQLMRYVDEFN